MKVLLVGADGQVGFELWRTLQFNREVIPTTSDGREVNGMTTIKLDLSDADDIHRKIDNIKPNFFKNIHGTHHMSCNEDYCVIDFVRRS